MTGARRLLALVLLACAYPVQAASLAIDMLEDSGDARYEAHRLDEALRLQPWGRPAAGAEVAVQESRFAAAALGLSLTLDRDSASGAAALEAALRRRYAQGVRFFIVDARAAPLAVLAQRVRDLDLLLFNVSALDDALRGPQCQPNLLHVVPSQAMLDDALGQYLASRKWRRVLVLRGPQAADRAQADSFARSARRYGIETVATRDFVPGRDPRQRERNDVALLTAGPDYDAVYVADSDGEFARDVPGMTQRPRVVVGSAGIVADGWHWAWERHGAPQLNARLRKAAGRRPTQYDWSAWMAVKAVVEAAQRTGGADFAKMRSYLRGESITLDGFKGFRMGFRPWDGQLRQPVLVTGDNAVLAVAPFDGFLDPRNALDTLGIDARESACRRGDGK